MFCGTELWTTCTIEARRACQVEDTWGFDAASALLAVRVHNYGAEALVGASRAAGPGGVGKAEEFGCLPLCVCG